MHHGKRLLSRLVPAALLLAATAVSGAGLGSAASAQVPTGGFTVGDVYVWSSSLSSSQFPVPFQGLIRVDGTTGATSLVKKVGSVYSNLCYDPFRDRLAMSMELTFTPYENGFYLCDAAGNLTKIPLPFLPQRVFSARNGTIYLLFNNGAWTELYYLDSGNNLHGVLDVAGTANHKITAPTSGAVHCYFDSGTNSILLFYNAGAGPCGGGVSIQPWVDRIPLNAAGTQVVGPEVATALCMPKDLTPSGVSRGPGNQILLALNGYSPGISARSALVDPVTLAITTYASADNIAYDTGLYSQVLQRALILDTFYDNIRSEAFGQVDSGTGGTIFTPNTSDPMVSSWGGSAEITHMATIDYGNSGLLAYGAGQVGCSGAETLTAPTAPKAGTTSFRFLGANAPPTSLGLCLVGDAQDTNGTDWFSIGVPLFVDVFNSINLIPLDIVSNAAGDASTVPFAIPANLVGSHFFAQALWYWPPATSCSLPPFNLSSTNGLEIIIQP